MKNLVQAFLVGVGVTMTSFGCASAPVIEFSVTPELVCPGDTIRLRLISEGHSGGEITADRTPAVGPVTRAYSSSDVLFLSEPTYQICDTTNFRAKFWNGDDTGCGMDYTSCADATASVAFGSVPVMRQSTSCGETAEFELTDREFGSLQIREIRNCTVGGAAGRPVELTSPDGTTVLIDGGGMTSAFNGQDLVGTFSARRTIVPPERCPPLFEVRPGITPPSPPPICLVFIAGCDGSDDCPE